MPDVWQVFYLLMMAEAATLATITLSFGSALIISRNVAGMSLRLRKTDALLAFAGFLFCEILAYFISDIMLMPKYEALDSSLSNEEYYNLAKNITLTAEETTLYEFAYSVGMLLFFFFIFLLKHKRKKIRSSLISTLIYFTFFYMVKAPIYNAFLLASSDWQQASRSFLYMFEPGRGSFAAYLMIFLVYILIFLGLFFGLYKKDRFLGVKPVHIIVICILFFAVNVVGSLPFSGENTQEEVSYLARMILALFVPLMVLTLGLILVLDNLREKQKEAIDFQAKYLEAELSYISQYKKNENETRKFRHDIINNLSLMDMMVKDGHTDEAREHLKQMLENINSLSRRFSTGDEMLDLIVTMKAAAMEDEKITFRCSGSLEEDLGMKAFDICGIFAGALDGAIEECKTDKDSAIDMVISENETSRIIKISNSFNGDPDRAFSGKINRSCIKAYGGTVKTSVKDNISELVLTFPRIVRREAVNV